jgi:hypothetical protein
MFWYVLYLIIVERPALRGVTVGPRDYAMHVAHRGYSIYGCSAHKSDLIVKAI